MMSTHKPKRIQSKSTLVSQNVQMYLLVTYLKKQATGQVAVVHTFNPGAQQSEADGSLSSRLAWSTEF